MVPDLLQRKGKVSGFFEDSTSILIVFIHDKNRCYRIFVIVFRDVGSISNLGGGHNT